MLSKEDRARELFEELRKTSPYNDKGEKVAIWYLQKEAIKEQWRALADNMNHKIFSAEITITQRILSSIGEKIDKNTTMIILEECSKIASELENTLAEMNEEIPDDYYYEKRN